MNNSQTSDLKENPTLKDLQNYILQTGKERGWDQNNHLEIFLLLSEEIGELARAVRDYTGLYAQENIPKDRASCKAAMEEEFADVLNYILDLANFFEVDLEQAFRKKDAINAQRIWSSRNSQKNISK
ncbi:MAG: RS21-C6 protein [Bacteroidia bacterium]|nr:MAG: RS21-C6 protein [Bacteroidia bacterium]